MLKRKAFTLIELLVVIAIIALLIAIIIPALQIARKKGSSAGCMANVKNLSLGWVDAFRVEHGYEPPYWKLVEMARSEARAADARSGSA